MTAEGWRLLVSAAVNKDNRGDSGSLDLLARLLEEVDQAKQVLRDKGYGVTGMGWLETVAEIPEANA